MRRPNYPPDPTSRPTFRADPADKCCVRRGNRVGAPVRPTGSSTFAAAPSPDDFGADVVRFVGPRLRGTSLAILVRFQTAASTDCSSRSSPPSAALRCGSALPTPISSSSTSRVFAWPFSASLSPSRSRCCSACRRWLDGGGARRQPWGRSARLRCSFVRGAPRTQSRASSIGSSGTPGSARDNPTRATCARHLLDARLRRHPRRQGPLPRARRLAQTQRSARRGAHGCRRHNPRGGGCIARHAGH